jgi:PiT family inorganic phosphate transporter
MAYALGMYKAWNIGANDVANAMGTSVGSKSLTIVQAVVLAGLFEFLGAYLVGSRVTDTVRKGVVNLDAFNQQQFVPGLENPYLFLYGMLCVLVAAGIWLNIATKYGLPVSTTHSIIGALVGFGIATAGLEAVQWKKTALIGLSWLVTPFIGALIAAGMFTFLLRTILRSKTPLRQTVRWSPVLVFVISAILVCSFIVKALKSFDIPKQMAVLIGLGIATVLGLLTWAIVSRVNVEEAAGMGKRYRKVEGVFSKLQVLTACMVAFAHGANDVANAIGPVAAVQDIVGQIKESGVDAVVFGKSKVDVDPRLLLMGGIGIVVGLATYGYRVMKTVGEKIIDLLPTRGFSAEFGAATTVLLFSLWGKPVSTTHTLVGCVIGVGLVRGLHAVNTAVLKDIVNCWIWTIPATAILAGVLIRIIMFVLGGA